MRRLLILLLLVLSTTVQGGTTLKIATLSPEGTSWMRTMRAAAAAIQQQTGGRVELRFYPGGVMGNDQSVMRKIRIGQLQGGAVTAGGLAAVSKSLQIYATPFLFHDLDEVDYVRGRMDPELLADLERQGFVGFGIAEGGFAYLMSTDPVRTVEEARSRKVWSPEGDRIALVAFNALGIHPVALPLTDVLTGLQTGLIDTVASSPAAAVALQWHTRISYVTELPLLYTYGLLVIDSRAFRRLSTKDQATLRSNLSRAFREINTQSRNDNEQARSALANQGIRFVSPAESDLEHWLGKVDEAVHQLEAEGNISASALRRARGLLTTYRAGR